MATLVPRGCGFAPTTDNGTRCRRAPSTAAIALFYSDSSYVHATPATPQNTLKLAAAKDPGDVTTVWVLLRDDRGGTAWLSFPVRRLPPESCASPRDVIVPDTGDAWFTGDPGTTTDAAGTEDAATGTADSPAPGEVAEPTPDAIEPDAGGAE
jgi:streptogramin lyase